MSRRQYVLIVDECQNLLTDDIETIITQMRKFGLSIIAACQHLGQFADFPKLLSALLNSVNSWAIFRTGATDAAVFKRDVFVPNLDQVKDIRLRQDPTVRGATIEETVWRPLNEIWELEERKLTELNDFEFYFRQRGRGRARKLRVRPPAPVRRTPRHIAAREELIALSSARYARPIAEVEAEIAARREALAPKPKEGKKKPSRGKRDIPPSELLDE